jgi:hypothetical protein
MKKVLLLLLFIGTIQSQTVNLDCSCILKDKITFDLPSSKQIGDEVFFQFDIDLDNKTAKVPNWTNDIFVVNANDKANNLSISDTHIVLGQKPPSGDYAFIISREDLSISTIMNLKLEGYRGTIEFFEGTCDIVKRKKVETLF